MVVTFTAPGTVYRLLFLAEPIIFMALVCLSFSADAVTETLMFIVLPCSLKSSADAPVVKSRPGLFRRRSSFRFRCVQCEVVSDACC